MIEAGFGICKKCLSSQDTREGGATQGSILLGSEGRELSTINNIIPVYCNIKSSIILIIIDRIFIY
jgi:hypothetical protein